MYLKYVERVIIVKSNMLVPTSLNNNRLSKKIIYTKRIVISKVLQRFSLDAYSNYA